MLIQSASTMWACDIDGIHNHEESLNEGDSHTRLYCADRGAHRGDDACLQAEADGFNTFSELSTYYLQQRAWLAPIIPPFLPSAIDTVEAMILNGDYSFQDWNSWYFGWSDGPHSAAGDLATYDGQTLITYEDLSSASIKIATSDGKLLASFASEPFPNLNALKEDEYARAFLALTDYRSAFFDMPLRARLEDLCEFPGNAFNISRLAHAGLVNRAPQWAVPFAESHIHFCHFRSFLAQKVDF